jgi:hypothetical protein
VTPRAPGSQANPGGRCRWGARCSHYTRLWWVHLLVLAQSRLTALSSGATPASRTEGERSETEVKAAGVVACSELLGGALTALGDLVPEVKSPNSDLKLLPERTRLGS